MGRRQELFARLERDMRDERASALVRIATTLEQLINQLESLRATWAATSETPDRAAIRERYRLTRKEALLYRWYLEVQREAVGVTRHAMLDEVYRVPGPLRDSD
jgi:hypothetical protein